jgi:hypothetical protein
MPRRAPGDREGERPWSTRKQVRDSAQDHSARGPERHASSRRRSARHDQPRGTRLAEADESRLRGRLAVPAATRRRSSASPCRRRHAAAAARRRAGGDCRRSSAA